MRIEPFYFFSSIARNSNWTWLLFEDVDFKQIRHKSFKNTQDVNALRYNYLGVTELYSFSFSNSWHQVHNLII